MPRLNPFGPMPVFNLDTRHKVKFGCREAIGVTWADMNGVRRVQFTSPVTFTANTMATQGLLSITRGGKVVAKIVTGADGYAVVDLAATLRVEPTTDPAALMELCRTHGLGGSSLIIQTSPKEYLQGSEGRQQRECLPDLYEQKFHDPNFNPRWARGTCDFTEIVDLDKPPAE